MRGIVDYINERDAGRWVIKISDTTIGVFPDVKQKPTPGYELLPGIQVGDELEIETVKKGKWVNAISIKKISVAKSTPQGGPLASRTSREEQTFINRRTALDKAAHLAGARMSAHQAQGNAVPFDKMVGEVISAAARFSAFLEEADKQGDPDPGNA